MVMENNIETITIAINGKSYKLVEVSAEQANGEKTMCLVTLVTPFGGITKAYSLKDVCVPEGTYDNEGDRFIVRHCTDAEFEEYKKHAKEIEEPAMLLQVLLDIALSEIDC
jgi:hypothetical protein